jgi:imidazolonepropionase-like amidohydrolase
MWSLFVFLLALTGRASHDTPALDLDRLTLRHATVVDVRANALLTDRAVVIERGMISAVVPEPYAGGGPERDLAGRFVLPGLIDMHVHLTAGPPELMADRMRLALAGGVTSVRDMGGDGERLRSLAESPALDRPGVFYSAVVAGASWMDHDPRARGSAHGGRPGSQPWLRTLGPDTDVAEVVGTASAFGVSAMKVYADLPAGRIAELSRHARVAGLQVWGHASVFPAGPADVIAARLDVVSHAEYLLYALDSVVPSTYHQAHATVRPNTTRPVSDLTPLLDSMAQAGTALDATLFVTQVRATRQMRTRVAEQTYQVVGQAYRRGVPILAGTDALVSGNGTALHDELELLVERAGLTPIDALRGATLHAAHYLGLTGEIGVVESGARADLVVLLDDPLEDIGNIRRVDFVVKGGAVVAAP